MRHVPFKHPSIEVAPYHDPLIRSKKDVLQNIKPTSKVESVGKILNNVILKRRGRELIDCCRLEPRW